MQNKKTKPRDKDSKPNPDHNPNHQETLKKLNRVIGQLEGIKRMILERRYCPDILTQTRAATAALRNVEVQILEKHLGHCVSQAMNSKSPTQASEKISEVIDIMKRF